MDTGSPEPPAVSCAVVPVASASPESSSPVQAAVTTRRVATMARSRPVLNIACPFDLGSALPPAAERDRWGGVGLDPLWPLDEDGSQDDHPLHDLLPFGGEVQLGKQVEDHGEDDDTHERADDRGSAAREAPAPDYR